MALVIVSSPSGGGKNTVIRKLIKIFPDSANFITTTSRPPRPGEKNGRDYFFVSKDEFEKMIKEKKFIEHNFYAGNYYGTEKEKMENLLKKHNLVFSNIDVHGRENFDQAGIKHLSIFLLPDSLGNLRQRIEKRGGVSPEILKERLETAEKEIHEAEKYNRKIVNYQGKLEETVKKAVEAIKEYLALDKKSALR